MGASAPDVLRPLRRWSPHVWWVAAVAVSVWLALAELQRAPAHATASVLLAVGFASAAALLLHQEHQRGNAALFVLLTVIWWCNELAKRPAGGLTAVVLVLGAQVEVVAAWVLLRYPASRLDRVDRFFVAVSSFVVSVLMVAEVLTNPPERLGVPAAPWPSVVGTAELGTAVVGARWAFMSVMAVVFLVLLGRRWWLMAPLERRTLRPILVTAAFVGVCTLPVVLNLSLSPAQRQTLFLVRSYGTVAIAFSFVASAIQMHLARSSLVTLVNRLDAPSTAASVEAALRDVLLDSALTVSFAIPGETGWFDDQGRRQEVKSDGRQVAVVTTTGDGQPLALVRVDPRLARYRTLLDAAITVSRFALENARLEAGLRAQLTAVREARSRLMSTGLQQRRQLERDLHDGAQQRLMAIGLRLGTLEASLADDPARAAAVAQLRKELHVALDELRDLARGIYPAVLSQAGLAAALEGVVERLPLRVELRVDPRRWPGDVESAAYLVVCEALTNAVRHAGDCAVRVEVAPDVSDLTVRVVDDGAGTDALGGESALRGLRDRVTALGGEFVVRSRPHHGTVIEARLPCG